MTKQEFMQYIQSFNKNPGEYTKDELYKIGVKHKELYGKEKNWKELATLLGCSWGGENYRKYVVRKQAEDGTLPKNTRELNSRTVEDITESDLVKQTRELFKQQQRLRDERTSYRKMLREDARIESLKSTIKDTVEHLKALPKVSFTAPERGLSTEAVLMFSDLHIGVLCDNYYNSFNQNIAEARVMKLVNDTIHYCQVNKVKRLNFVNLGDLIHGLIHITLRIEEEFDVVQQVMVASELVSKALNKLQEAAPEVIYRSCTDNHARAMANKHEAIEKENLGRLIDWFIEERLKDTKIKFAKDNLDVDLGKFSLLNGKTVMFAHGHNDTINSVFQNFIGATGEFIHYMLLGHYHNEKAKSIQNSRVFVNGSIVGSEQYATSKRLFSKPAQTLLIFDGENLINHSINLDIKPS